MARPSKYTPALAQEICDRLSNGEPLAIICRNDSRMPSARAVNNWIKAHPEFAERYDSARLEGFEYLAAQCIEIADDERYDWLLTKKGQITNEVAIARARLQVDARLKLLAKWCPKRYGDKIEHEHKGETQVRIVIGKAG